MNQKPFNLQDALNGKPVVTRDGRKVTELHHFKTVTHEFKLLAVVNGEDFRFKINGRWRTNDLEECELDLFMAHEKVTKWINIYRDEKGHVTTGEATYDSKECAEMGKWGADYITVTSITFEI